MEESKLVGYMKAKEDGKAHLLYEDNSIFAEAYPVYEVLEYLIINWVCGIKVIPYDESLPAKEFRTENKIMRSFYWEPSEHVLQFMRKK
ncbi:MAG: hypothetical protein WC708_00275 [Lentisphaeria bacterium]|jgi:hypothetical protein